MNTNTKARTQQSRKGESGFTLIELMVLLAILAILAAIAIPLYIRVLPKQSDFTGGLRTLNNPLDSGYDESAARSPEPSLSPLSSPEARVTPDTSQRMLNRSTNAPPAFRTSTPTPAPAASTRTPASAAPSSPEPVGVEPPHQGPPDSG